MSKSVRQRSNRLC